MSTIPAELEEVVLHALEKDPLRRAQDAGTFRSKLYAIAQLLGLEHAEGYSALTLDSLRSAGVESPSGRLVVDIERLRENRSARAKTRDAQSGNDDSRGSADVQVKPVAVEGIEESVHDDVEKKKS